MIIETHLLQGRIFFERGYRSGSVNIQEHHINQVTNITFDFNLLITDLRRKKMRRKLREGAMPSGVTSHKRSVELALFFAFIHSAEII